MNCKNCGENSGDAPYHSGSHRCANALKSHLDQLLMKTKKDEERKEHLLNLLDQRNELVFALHRLVKLIEQTDCKLKESEKFLEVYDLLLEAEESIPTRFFPDNLANDGLEKKQEIL